MHVIVNTWFDIGYVMSGTNHYSSKPHEAHLKVVKQIMWYMYNTQSYALLYPRKQHIFYENNVLLTFIDVNYGHELYTKKLDIS